MNSELLRLVDSIHRDKDVDQEIIFEALELAMLSAAHKQYGNREEVRVQIARESGEISVFDGDKKLDVMDLGRISAQAAKQIIIQRIREAERDVVFDDYEKRVGEIVNGVIQRFEGSNLIVNIGKTEGFLPRREQVQGENYRPGERIRALVIDVRKVGPRVRIALSRTHPDLIQRLFELEVPEIADHTIEIKALAREPGARSKIAVFSMDSKVDCVGACVGVRGTRIKNIVDELNGEKIDIVRWSDSLDAFIANALRPAEISSIHMDYDRNRTVVIVPEDMLALGIGKRGQNVRLAAKLVGWDIDIMTAVDFDKKKNQALEDFALLPGIDSRLAAKLVESGLYSLGEFADSDAEMLDEFEEIKTEDIDTLQDAAVDIIRDRRKQAAAERAAQDAAAAAGETAVETPAEPEPSAETAPVEAEASAEPATEAAQAEPETTTEPAAEIAPAEPEAAVEPVTEPEPAAAEPEAPEESATEATAEPETAPAEPEAPEESATEATAEPEPAPAEPEAPEESATEATAEPEPAPAEPAQEPTAAVEVAPEEPVEPAAEPASGLQVSADTEIDPGAEVASDAVPARSDKAPAQTREVISEQVTGEAPSATNTEESPKEEAETRPLPPETESEEEDKTVDASDSTGLTSASTSTDSEEKAAD